VPPGEELLSGALRDASAGAVVVLGPGGRSADALGHRVHRLAPLPAGEATAMLDETGMFATAHGRTLDRSVVLDCLTRVAWLADAVAELVEFEINPLVVTGAQGIALDVRGRVQPAAVRRAPAQGTEHRSGGTSVPGAARGRRAGC
jgi:hypothetical protein